MTIFDQFSSGQRLYTIQQLQRLLDTLKECALREQLIETQQLFIIGGPKMGDVEQQILEFAMNHFGSPYSHEAGE